jgi:CheY-like chemotaxis protein
MTGSACRRRRARPQRCSDPATLLDLLAAESLLTNYQISRLRAGNIAELVLGNYRVLDRVGATRVIMLSMNAGEDSVLQTLRAGAVGYLVKTADPPRGDVPVFCDSPACRRGLPRASRQAADLPGATAGRGDGAGNRGALRAHRTCCRQASVSAAAANAESPAPGIAAIGGGS